MVDLIVYVLLCFVGCFVIGLILVFVLYFVIVCGLRCRICWTDWFVWFVDLVWIHFLIVWFGCLLCSDSCLVCWLALVMLIACYWCDLVVVVCWFVCLFVWLYNIYCVSFMLFLDFSFGWLVVTLDFVVCCLFCVLLGWFLVCFCVLTIASLLVCIFTYLCFVEFGIFF